MSLADHVDLYWIIECDECGEEDDLPKEFCEDAQAAAAHFAGTAGWRESKEGRVLCHYCIKVDEG